jgi:hypothetical protein
VRRLGADHRYVPLLLTVPGIGWVLAYTIAAEIVDITRFPTPRKLSGCSGLCPRDARAYAVGMRSREGIVDRLISRFDPWRPARLAPDTGTPRVKAKRSTPLRLTSVSDASKASALGGGGARPNLLMAALRRFFYAVAALVSQ